MSISGLIPPGGFYSDGDFDFEARIAVGAASVGIGDVGLVLAVLDRVKDGDRKSWFDAWSDMASKLAEQGADAERQGHLDTASWALLTASEFFSRALVVVDGLSDQSVLMPTFKRHRECWDGVVRVSASRFVPVGIPYESTTLPGYMLRPDDSCRPRPTLVMTNGSDGSLPGLIGYGAAEALARDWNAFIFDGPGQQSMLFERGVPFRHDWEAVLTPVIDLLLTRPDVDGSALTGYGVSQGGYWVTRAIAYEHRLVAAVADPGVVDVSTTWTGHLPGEVMALLRSGQKDAFNGVMASVNQDPEMARTVAFRSRPYGIADAFDLFTEVMRYQVRDLVGLIRTPLLILDPQDEQFWPAQPKELHQLLPGVSDIAQFGRDQGANFQCQPAGRRLANMRMLDWLEGKVGDRGRKP